jgi:prophage maintenance system killer protein
MSSFYPALESLVNEPAPEDVLTIADTMSDGNDVLHFEEYFQDVNDLSADIVHDVADADRCMEVTSVLAEMVNAVGSRVSEATPVEARLVELVGDMACAGTDANPEDVVPTMEAYGDGESTMKKVKENIAKMWAWVKQLIAKIIEKTKLFFKAVFKSSVALDQRLKHLTEAIDKADSATFKGGKLTLSARESAALATGTALPKGLDSLTAQFSTLEVYRAYFFTTYHAYVTNRMTSLREAIEKFDLAHPEMTLSLLADRLKAVKFPEVPGLKNSQVIIMGQHRIITENDGDKDRKAQAAAVSPGHYLEVSRKTVVELHRDTDHAEVKAGSIEVQNLGQIKALVARTSKFVNAIEAFSQHPFAELEAHQADLSKELEKLSKKLQEHAEKDHGIKAAEHAFQLISNHVASVASWIDQPIRAYTAYAIRQAAAIEQVADRALKLGTTAQTPKKA